MADTTDAAPTPNDNAASDAKTPDIEQEKVLLVLIVSGALMLDELVTGLLDIGVAGTVIESKGLMALLREEMPIFGGLASMLPQTTGSKVLLSVTTRDLADRVFDVLETEFKQAQRPIALTVPIERLVGLRR